MPTMDDVQEEITYAVNATAAMTDKELLQMYDRFAENEDTEEDNKPGMLLFMYETLANRNMVCINLYSGQYVLNAKGRALHNYYKIGQAKYGRERYAGDTLATAGVAGYCPG